MKKWISIIIILLISIVYFANLSYAVDFPVQPKVENFLLLEGDQVGYNIYDGNYVNFIWDELESEGLGESKYLNIYANKIIKPYRAPENQQIIASDMTEDILEYKASNLESGTIYNFIAKAYYIYEDNGVLYQSPLSEPSDSLKVLTDIKIEAFQLENDRIKILWDDVWDTGNRISYKLYISEDAAFEDVTPIYFSESDIGENKIVSTNEEKGKLEYIHQVGKPGTIYYIKIVPLGDDLNINPEGSVIKVSSYLKTNVSKISTTDYVEDWKIDWQPVTINSDSEYSVSYQIFKGIEIA